MFYDFKVNSKRDSSWIQFLLEEMKYLIVSSFYYGNVSYHGVEFSHSLEFDGMWGNGNVLIRIESLNNRFPLPALLSAVLIHPTWCYLLTDSVYKASKQNFHKLNYISQKM